MAVGPGGIVQTLPLQAGTPAVGHGGDHADSVQSVDAVAPAKQTTGHFCLHRLQFNMIFKFQAMANMPHTS